MKEFICPLCKSDKAIIVNKKDTRDIVEGYKRQYNVDVTPYYIGVEKIFSMQCTNCDLVTHSPSKPGTSDFYNQMQQHPFYYEKEKREFNYAIEKIKQTKINSLVEIGSGEGNFLKKVRNSYDVSAIEYSTDAIQKLEQSGLRLHKEENQYDFVVSFQVLEHVSDVRGFIDSAVKLLKKDGYLLFTVPNFDSPYIKEGGSPLLDFPPHHMTQWTKKALHSIGDIFKLNVEEYYIENIRIEHLLTLMSARRNPIIGQGITAGIIRKIARTVDKVMAPYYLDNYEGAGVTHGILLKKV
ncbi:MAG: class I SAM-dependent methyltransferase [Candidatus Heimdallarchaeota archaeon]|nr:class I SAM-dependent methyltransferase [Candidatus Heimdallarchaeota archaeon]